MSVKWFELGDRVMTTSGPGVVVSLPSGRFPVYGVNHHEKDVLVTEGEVFVRRHGTLRVARIDAFHHVARMQTLIDFEAAMMRRGLGRCIKPIVYAWMAGSNDA